MIFVENPDMSMTGDRLRHAATRVRQGWIRNEILDDENRVCALGAIANISYPSNVFFPKHAPDIVAATAALCKALGHTFPDGDYDGGYYTLHERVIVTWNDTPGRTADEVATALEFAALIADAEADARDDQRPSIEADARRGDRLSAGARIVDWDRAGDLVDLVNERTNG